MIYSQILNIFGLYINQFFFIKPASVQLNLCSVKIIKRWTSLTQNRNLVKHLKKHLILPGSHYISGFITLQKLARSYVQFVFLKRKMRIHHRWFFKLEKSITEIQEIRRFTMPSQICSYVGYKKYKRECWRHNPQRFISRKIWELSNFVKNSRKCLFPQ